MSDMADGFRFMKELRLKKRKAVEPTRTEYAVNKLKEAGHHVQQNPEDDVLIIVNDSIQFFPYTGWYSGKGIGSGRGINNLIKRLKETK